MSAYIRLRRAYPNFARLWLAQIVSMLGDWFNTIVLVALVSKYSGGSGLAVSLFLMVRVLAPLLISPYAGVLADRFDRKRLLIASDVLRAIIVLLLLLASGPATLWLIYGLTALQFMLAAIFDPARSAIIPNLLPQDELVLANTLSSASWSVMLAVGSLLGGIMAAWLGTTAVLLIDALTFLVSAVLISTVRVKPAAAPSMKTEAATGSLREGIRFAFDRPAFTLNLLVKAGGTIVNSETLMVVFATQVFVSGANGEQSLGLLYGVTGLGAVLGPVLLNRFNDGRVTTMNRLILVGFALIPLGMALLASAPGLLVVALALMIRAMGGSANWTYSSVIIQMTVPDAYMGRMFALDNAIFQLVASGSMLLTGVLVDIAGPTYMNVLVGGLTLVTMIPLVLWWWGTKRLQPAIPVAVGD